jgi:hypothetical protein
VTGPTIFGKIRSRTPTQKLRYSWTAELPFYVRAMVKATDKLIVCGPEKIIDEQDAARRYPDASLSDKLAQQDAILDGQRGSHLWVVDAESGEILERHRLPSLAMWDGMAAVGDVYLTTQDGVICLAGQEGGSLPPLHSYYRHGDGGRDKHDETEQAADEKQSGEVEKHDDDPVEHCVARLPTTPARELLPPFCGGQHNDDDHHGNRDKK